MRRLFVASSLGLALFSLASCNRPAGPAVELINQQFPNGHLNCFEAPKETTTIKPGTRGYPLIEGTAYLSSSDFIEIPEPGQWTHVANCVVTNSQGQTDTLLVQSNSDKSTSFLVINETLPKTP